VGKIKIETKGNLTMLKIKNLLFLLTIAILSLSFFVACQNGNAFEIEVLNITNEMRAEHDLPPLIWNRTLGNAARQHSLDMQENNNMSHTSSDGTTFSERMRALEIENLRRWGENVARGQRTPLAVV